MLTAREIDLRDLDKAMETLDGHAYEYIELNTAYSFLVQYRALLDQKWDEIQDLLVELEDTS